MYFKSIITVFLSIMFTLGVFAEQLSESLLVDLRTYEGNTLEEFLEKAPLEEVRCVATYIGQEFPMQSSLTLQGISRIAVSRYDNPLANRKDIIISLVRNRRTVTITIRDSNTPGVVTDYSECEGL